MGRLNWARPAVLACLGALVTVIVLPQTSWVTKNLIDSMRYGVDHSEGMDFNVSKNVLNGDLLTDGSSETGMAKAMLGDEDANRLVQAMMKKQSNDVRSQLLTYTKAHPKDPMGWATLLRYSLMYGHLGREKNGEWDPKVFETYQVGMAAARQGALAVPENAYFPLFEACIRHESGDDAVAFEVLHAVSKAKKYQDYVHQSVALETAVIERKWGYRGEALRYQLAASTLLPHLAHLRSFGRSIAEMPKDISGMTVRRDMFRAVDVWSQGSETFIDTLVQNAICSTILATVDKPRKGVTVDERQAFYAAHVPKLEADMRKVGVDFTPGEFARVYDRLTRYTLQGGAYLDKAVELENTLRVDQQGFSTRFKIQTALAGVLIVLVVALCASMIGRFKPEASNLAVPFIFGGLAQAWCFICLDQPQVKSIGNLQSTVLALTMMAGVAISFTQAGLKHSRLVKIVVIAISAMLFGLSPSPYLAALGVLMTAWVVAGRRRGFALCFAGATILYVCLGIQQFLGDDLISRTASLEFASGIIALSLAALIPYAQNSRVVLVSSVCAACLCYVGMVAFEVRQNEIVRPTYEAFIHEMDIIRGTRPAPSS